MTRLASIMGVATVATLVLLSGCESAVKTDYAKKLAGTWTVSTTATAPNPEAVPGAPTDTPPTIQIPATVAVAIVDGTGVNTGTFSLTVVTPTGALDPTTQMPITMETQGTGSISVDATEIEVTLTSISDTAPASVKELKGVAATVTYELADNELTIESQLLVQLGLMSSLTLTKQ